jgi:hypothetical protein
MNRLWLLSGECRWINNNPRLNHPLIYSKPCVCFPSALGRKQVFRKERGIARPILYQETLPLDDRRRCYKVLGICYATSLLYEFTTTSGFLEGKKKNVDLGRKPYTHQLTEKRKCLMGRQSDKPLALTQLGQCLDVVSESRRRSSAMKVKPKIIFKML